MRKTIFLSSLIILVISLAVFVSAYDTEITVWTMPNHKVGVQVLDPTQIYLLLNSYHMVAGETGKVTFTYSGSESVLKLKVQISKDGTPLVFDGQETTIFEDFPAGDPIYIQMMPGDVKRNYMESAEVEVAPEENLTEVQVVVEEVVEPVEDNSLTGNVVSEEGEGLKIPSLVYYISGLIVVLVVVLFFIVRGVASGKAPKRINIVPMSSIQNPESAQPADAAVSTELEEAKKRLREAQQEIQRMKNQSQIDALEKKIEAEKREIERLRGGVEF